MKIVFLYMSKSSASPDDPFNEDWLYTECGPQYDHYVDEGYFRMFESLVQDSNVDLKVFFESNINPGQAKFVKGAECYVVPHIEQVDQFIDKDTIIFVRGGFKHWHDWLRKYKGKNWLVMYAANTGREKWAWWDIVFDDLRMSNTIDGAGRYWFPFIKPVNSDIFHLKEKSSMDYDICIGASNIHDKKGQFQVVRILEQYHSLYGHYPKCVMPGSPVIRGETAKMMETDFIKNHCYVPGTVRRSELADIMNRSKIMMHLGPGGQNDRSVAEAMACGCFIIMANPDRFSPLLKPDEEMITHMDPDKSPAENAKILKEDLMDPLNVLLSSKHRVNIRRSIETRFSNLMGFETKVMPRIKELFFLMGSLSPNKDNLALFPTIFHKYKFRR